jgi:hypothetical protein
MTVDRRFFKDEPHRLLLQRRLTDSVPEERDSGSSRPLLGAGAAGSNPCVVATDSLGTEQQVVVRASTVLT